MCRSADDGVAIGRFSQDLPFLCIEYNVLVLQCNALPSHTVIGEKGSCSTTVGAHTQYYSTRVTVVLEYWSTFYYPIVSIPTREGQSTVY